MIYTLTLNPSVDYFVELSELRVDDLNRTKDTKTFPGGKGINVSQVLKTLGTDTHALGFIGGFTGDYIDSFLQNKQIDTSFIVVEEDTRINVKLQTDMETEINADGPHIKEEQVNQLKKQIERLTSIDILVMAGNIPSTLPDDIYEDLITICRKSNVKYVLDVEGHLLETLIDSKPFLIKPNEHELSQLFNVVIKDKDTAIVYGKKLLDMGVENVLISLGANGAVLINKDMVLTSDGLVGDVKSSVGAGDSMLAGFLGTYMDSRDMKEAFKYALASGSATAFSYGLCHRKKVDSLLEEVQINEIS